ncbi:MAG: hypothetical protein DYH01_02720 [Chlorobi bacterium CHB7]|nr:hypothetical protein [Chlorobi bacterium CHB7]
MQDLPPGEYSDIPDVVYETNKSWMSDEVLMAIRTPDLQMHCDNEKCNGVRLFEYNQFPMHYEYRSIEGGDTSYDYAYIEYLCQNCKENLKSFGIMIIKIHDDKKTADIIKFGEYPFYGPHIPSKLISLIGPDRELFLRGIKCEAQNLGIAAFSYYRRVIENQRNRLIDNISDVLKKLNVDQEALTLLEMAKSETHFKTSMDKLKPYLPKTLLIHDTNPLTLLHKGLSVGLHGLSDDECLEYAHSIRVVLTELADRLKSLLSDHNELKKAMNNLNKLK